MAENPETEFRYGIDTAHNWGITRIESSTLKSAREQWQPLPYSDDELGQMGKLSFKDVEKLPFVSEKRTIKRMALSEAGRFFPQLFSYMEKDTPITPETAVILRPEQLGNLERYLTQAIAAMRLAQQVNITANGTLVRRTPVVYRDDNEKLSEKELKEEEIKSASPFKAQTVELTRFLESIGLGHIVDQCHKNANEMERRKELENRDKFVMDFTLPEN